MDQYLVYGNPIKQSRSPFIHQYFAQQTQQPLTYGKQLAEIEDFKAHVKAFVASGGKGANVTAPFKEQAMELCDELSAHAKLAGAVNTLTFKGGKIFGDTTDGVGLVNDLLNHQVELKGKKVLLLGAGGAAKGVVLPILDQQPARLTIANRTVSKAEAIADLYTDASISACSFDDANQLSFDLIINATSAGLSGTGLPIADSVITSNTVCYDMVYGAKPTPFLQQAKKLGAKKVIDGLGMLVGQAAVSFEIWRGVKPNSAELLAILRKELSEQ